MDKTDEQALDELLAGLGVPKAKRTKAIANIDKALNDGVECPSRIHCAKCPE